LSLETINKVEYLLEASSESISSEDDLDSETHRSDSSPKTRKRIECKRRVLPERETNVRIDNDRKYGCVVLPKRRVETPPDLNYGLSKIGELVTSPSATFPPFG
jgi:hypothetical protein